MHYEMIEENTIRDVWQHNLEDEFKVIRNIVLNYPFISMDTEFPGAVINASPSMCNYKTISSNVDMMSIIQLGLTFSDAHGRRPYPTSTWQFNFKWDRNTEEHNSGSIELLENAGIQFERHRKEGIFPQDFGELIMTSGLILCDNVTWITFHSCYDFAYLMKVITCLPMPDEANDFYEIVEDYFKIIYDIKYVMTKENLFRGGLQGLADVYQVTRIGQQHQAGSDSRLTQEVFFKLYELYKKEFEEWRGFIFGYEPISCEVDYTAVPNLLFNWYF